MVIESVIIYNYPNSNSHKVASIIENYTNYDCFSLSDSFNLSDYNFFIFVVANFGDEELNPRFEDFFESISLKNKEFICCELGNCFGNEEKHFGCVHVVKSILSNLDWTDRGSISFDSFPNLDQEEVKKWIKSL